MLERIDGRDTASELSGIIDAVSISLNEMNAEEYVKLCKPEFGIDAYEAMLDYTKRVKNFVSDVTMSVVGYSIPASHIESCRKIAEKLAVKFRVR